MKKKIVLSLLALALFVSPKVSLSNDRAWQKIKEHNPSVDAYIDMNSIDINTKCQPSTSECRYKKKTVKYTMYIEFLKRQYQYEGQKVRRDYYSMKITCYGNDCKTGKDCIVNKIGHTVCQTLDVVTTGNNYAMMLENGEIIRNYTIKRSSHNMDRESSEYIGRLMWK